MGIRSGGGNNSGGSGRAFASTYGTRGYFKTYGSSIGIQEYPGSTGRRYLVQVFGDKKVGTQPFKTAKEANDFMKSLSQNGFKVAPGTKVKSYTEAYGKVNASATKIDWTTTKPK